MKGLLLLILFFLCTGWVLDSVVYPILYFLAGIVPYIFGGVLVVALVLGLVQVVFYPESFKYKNKVD
jgi:membrane protein YdbS with pleckstrin-like domain